MNSVVVTGSAGFIGSHLAEYYLKHGWKVIGLDNYLTGSVKNTEYLLKTYPAFQFTEMDVCARWDKVAAENLKYVFHLASPASVKSYQKHALETMWANSAGLNNAILFANQQKARVIFSSTSEVYGSPLSSPQKETDWGYVNSFGERSCYDESKRFGEALIYSANKTHATSHGIVRIFNTYGPRMHESDDRVIHTFIKQALSDSDLTVFGDGKQTRSFCFIADLIKGLAAYAESSLSEPVNLGNDEEKSILDLAETVLKITGANSKIVFQDLPQDDPPQRRPDLSKAKSKLNYFPEISLEDGLRITFFSRS